MRKKIVAANWKMNGSKELLSEFKKADLSKDAVDIIYGLPSVFLDAAQQLGLKNISAEDVSAEDSGAYTGEISANMLKELNVTYCIIGHSERRSMHNEDEELLTRKWQQLKTAGITPIYCIGESEVEYDNGNTEQAIERQIQPMLEAGLIDANTIIAYEPVWAIGTGKAATAEYAQEVCAKIRQRIAKKYANMAAELRILYGGSVKGNNAGELIQQSDIDGFLVGGASLKVNAFSAIIGAV